VLKLTTIVCCTDGLNGIPDLSVAGSDFYTYFFYTNFTPPAAAASPVQAAGVTVDEPQYTLTLHGIGYSVQLWVNGVLIPALPPESVPGHTSLTTHL
jgi:hypothetical protein